MTEIIASIKDIAEQVYQYWCKKMVYTGVIIIIFLCIFGFGIAPINEIVGVVGIIVTLILGLGILAYYTFCFNRDNNTWYIYIVNKVLNE